MKKVIITGASGFIGSALAKRLLQSGVTVYGVGRNLDKLNALKSFGNFIPVVADFADYGRLDEIIPERNFDMFWHFAWLGTTSATYKDSALQVQNMQITYDIIQSIAKLSNKASMSGTNYQQCDINIDNDDNPFNPVAYGIVKKAATDLFKILASQNNISCNNLIFPNTFGELDKQESAIILFIKKLQANEPLNLISGDYPDDWLYIDDLVDGIIAAEKSTKNYTEYYIGHRKITTFKEKLLAMKKILSSNSELNFGKYPETNRVDCSKFDLDALYNDTGYTAKTDFAESIRKTADWLDGLK